MANVMKRQCSSEREAKKRRSPAYQELTGQLTARSHILHSRPECIILEICSKDTVNYVICEELQSVLSNNSLNIGQYYKFLNLTSGFLKLKNKTIQSFKVTKDTVWIEVSSENEVYQLPSLDNITILQGKVTKVDSALGICYLYGTVMVILSTCSRVALVPQMKEGQVVTIFHAHRMETENREVLYAMCVKSYVRIEEEVDYKIPPLHISPLLLCVGDVVRDYRLIMWLKECSLLLERIFTKEFLLSSGIPHQECEEFRSTLLLRVAKNVIKFDVERTSIIEEFVATDHNLFCGALKKSPTLPSVTSLFDLDSQNSTLEDITDEDGSNVFWQYHVKKSVKKFLIGRICVKNTTYRLNFQDANCSLPCVIRQEEGRGMAKLNKKVVLILEHDIIREKFSFTNRGASDRNLKYLSVVMDKVVELSSLGRDWRNHNSCNIRAPDADSQSQSINLGAFSNFTSTTFNESGRDSHLNREFFLSPQEKTFDRYLSQYIFIQTKSSPMVAGEKIAPRCLLLVSLLGEMVKYPCHPHLSSRGPSSTSIFISLEKSMLGIHPLIAINTVYELRFPIQFDVNFFKKGSPAGSIVGLRNYLPTIACVTLPSYCQFHLVNDYTAPCDSLKFRECYRVEQALQEANYHELINVVGFVVERFHQEPKYEREKLEVKVNGFGIPGNSIIAVVLRDTPPLSQTGTPATVYLTFWNTLQYQYALVPGAKVIFRFVMKVKPTTTASGVYFRSSVLTSLEIVDLVDSENKIESVNSQLSDQADVEPSKPRSLLDSILFDSTVECRWMSVSMAQLLKVSISASCSSCKHPIRNRTCTFVGCSSPQGSNIGSRMTFSVREFDSANALVFVPDAQVKKVFQESEKMWEMLVILAETCGQLEYRPYASVQDVSCMSLEQRVFRVLCESFLSGRRFHLHCRKFNDKKNKEFAANTPALYSVDISTITMLSATS